MSLIHNIFPELKPFYYPRNDYPFAPFSELTSQIPRPAIDVHEETDKYVVQADVAGARKEDIKLEFGGDGGEVLTLSGKIVKSKETKPEEGNAEGGEGGKGGKKSFWHTERFEGTFARSIRFPTPVDTDGVKAKYENGVLEVDVPKKAKTAGKKSIEIA